MKDFLHTLQEFSTWFSTVNFKGENCGFTVNLL